MDVSEVNGLFTLEVFGIRGVNNIMWKCIPMAKSVAKE